MKKLFVFAAVLVAAVTSQASYLYWQIEDMTVGQGTPALQDEWNTVNLYYREIGSKNKGTAISTLDHIAGGSTYREALDLSAITEQSNYAFYIELVSNTKGVVGVTGNWETQTYTALHDAGMITSDLTEMPPAVWHGGTVGAPEPTSAMLMLLGVAGLALKRKQKKA